MEHIAEIRLGPEDFFLFQEYRNKRLHKLPSECLISLQPELPTKNYFPPSTREIEKIPTTALSERQTEELMSTSQLHKVWDQFNKELHSTQEKEVQDSTSMETDKNLEANKTKYFVNGFSIQMMDK